MFDWTIFATVLTAGLVLSALFWYIMRDVERALEASRLEAEKEIISRQQREIRMLKEKVAMLEGRINALQVDIDVLREVLMKDLRKPPRR